MRDLSQSDRFSQKILRDAFGLTKILISTTPFFLFLKHPLKSPITTLTSAAATVITAAKAVMQLYSYEQQMQSTTSLLAMKQQKTG